MKRSDAPQVLHVGPDPTGTGGMATVLRAFSGARWSDDAVVTVASSWDPEDRLFGLASTLKVCRRVVAARLRGRARIVVHTHISEGGSFVRKGLVAATARLCGHTVLTTLHGADFHLFAAERPRVTRLVLGLSHGLIALAPSQADIARVYFRGPVHVIPNPVPPGFLTEDAASATPEGRLIVLFAGEVGERKGVDVLLAAWGLLLERGCGLDLELVIAGPDGGLAGSVLPDQCAMVGALSATEVKALLDKAVLAVLPSRREVYPMFLLEAMGSGVPWVGTAVGGVPAMAEWGGGSVVAPEDAEALALAMERVLDDRELWLAMSARGSGAAAGVLSIESVVTELETAYGSVARA